LKKSMPKVSCNYDFAIVSHILANGPAQALEEYLFRKKYSYLFIGHPFLERSTERSFCRLSNAVGTTRELICNLPVLPAPYRYALDFLLTIWWACFHGPVDILVGCGSINAFAGLVLRRMGRVRRVVFYAIDYAPQRFRHSLLNRIHHLIERICVARCDVVWNLSSAMIEARIRDGVATRRSAPQLVVPMGAGFDLAKRRDERPRDDCTIAFIGHLLEKQGVQVILHALPQIVAAAPTARLLVMGTGPYESQLRQLATSLGVQAHVEFTGFIRDFQVVQRRLAQSAIGIAPYLDQPDGWTKYADPGKLKDYLAAGLPIITTAVSPIARQLEAAGAAIVTPPTSNAIATAVIHLLIDRSLRERMAAVAVALAQEYDWEHIFGDALEKSLNLRIHNI
jgi:glycosyltransferase involved in cell wall biosynthesis